jgi:hypothetical protein
LSGRVTYRGAPVPGAVVTLYDRYDPPKKHILREVDCAGDGGFAVAVPPGIYYVEARGIFDGKEIFAFTGQNPLRLEKGRRWLGMKAVPVGRVESEPGDARRGAMVIGEVLFGGTPVEDAYVYVYSLEQGDLYGFYPGNPVYLKGGMVTRVRLETVKKEKPLSYAEITSGTETLLKGRVVDRTGAPQPGVYAFVYDNRVFGHKRPYGHSGKTGPDGAFAIYLDRPGVFYLGARENFGNSPKPGERFGFYDGTPDHSIEVPRGKTIAGLEIVVDRILPEGK